MIHTCKQYSDEWWNLREGKMTGSNAQAIGANGKGLETYILQVMAEKYSTAERENWSNEHTDRGMELEEQAREIYQLEKGVKVKEVGLITNPKISKMVSVSPDGLIGKNGGIEIKCLMDRKHFEQVVNGIKEESKYLWQMQMQMLVGGLEWVDYILYNPNFKKSLLVKRVFPDDDKRKKLIAGIKKGEELIKIYKKKYV